jgi:hypothetical protein
VIEDPIPNLEKIEEKLKPVIGLVRDRSFEIRRSFDRKCSFEIRRSFERKMFFQN